MNKMLTIGNENSFSLVTHYASPVGIFKGRNNDKSTGGR